MEPVSIDEANRKWFEDELLKKGKEVSDCHGVLSILMECIVYDPSNKRYVIDEMHLRSKDKYGIVSKALKI